MTKTSAGPITVGFSHPRASPCPMTIFKATMAMMNARKPNQSNRGRSAVVTLFSGVSLSRKALTAATAIDIQKIHRHLREDATRPPKSAQSPEPPQEPMDQKLTARCRSLPSKESFSRASVISFGLVSIPVQLYVAARPKTVSFQPAPRSLQDADQDPVALSTP